MKLRNCTMHDISVNCIPAVRVVDAVLAPGVAMKNLKNEVYQATWRTKSFSPTQSLRC